MEGMHAVVAEKADAGMERMIPDSKSDTGFALVTAFAAQSQLWREGIAIS